MNKAPILLGLWSCVLPAVAALDASPPIARGNFDAAANAQLGGLARGAGAGALAAGAAVRLSLPLPDLAPGGAGDFLLGLECAPLPPGRCGRPDVLCYDCAAYGASASGLPDGFVAYAPDLPRSARCTALIVANGAILSGVVTDPRGYKYQITTPLLPDSSGATAILATPRYGYEGINMKDFNITHEGITMKDFGITLEDPGDDQVALLADITLEDPGDDQLALLAEPENLFGSPVPPPAAKSSPIARASAADDGSIITLMYYLTKRPMCQWTSQDYATCQYTDAAQEIIETMAAECTAWGNLALSNSNVAYAYENVLVHVDQDYDEGTSGATRLKWITASAAAAALRDQHRADLVLDVFYMAGNMGAGGVAWVPAAFPSRHLGFSSQGGLFILMDSIIAHEIGHNMGLNHNREQYDDGATLPTANFGWNNCDECFRTIMSYNSHCLDQGCTSVPQIQYFSNVDVEYTTDAGTFPMGDANNDCSATLDLSRVGVAMNRFQAPQLLLENRAPRYNVGSFFVFSVIAAVDMEVNNVEFVLGGGMRVKLYTASGSWEGNMQNDGFWGDAHVAEDIGTQASLLDTYYFQSFPALALSQGSTTSFRLQHEESHYMYKAAAPAGLASGDVAFGNDHLNVTVGLMGNPKGGIYTINPVTLHGALRYSLVSATGDSSSGSPSESPSIASSDAPSTSPSGSPSAASSDAPSGSPSGSPSAAPTDSPSGSPSGSPSAAPSDSPSGSSLTGCVPKGRFQSSCEEKNKKRSCAKELLCKWKNKQCVPICDNKRKKACRKPRFKNSRVCKFN